MNRKLDRRNFLGVTAAALLPAVARAENPVRIGIVGVGNRGTSLLRLMLSMKDVSIPALCDIDVRNLAAGQEMVEQSGRPKPYGYSRNEHDFERLMSRDDLDAVVIATPWEWHTVMAVYCMRAGKFTACEVPAALTFEECWSLVDTHEKTGIPYMMLENWCYREDNLTVLNMIRKGLLGEIVHCHCAYSHDCIYWYFDEKGYPKWSGKFLTRRNANPEPTHAIGPALSWMDLNCGDYFSYATTTASRPLGIYSGLSRRFSPKHPSVNQKYLQGDIVTTVIKTHRGNTIVVNNDMQLPRPYDNRWLIQGTLGLYSHEHHAVYLEGVTKGEVWEPFDPYQTKFGHSLWTSIPADSPDMGHGGADYLVVREFVKSAQKRTPPPIDVYDSVLMSSIIPLSQESIAKASAPVTCPDFTRGKWQTRKPSFALNNA
jgi:predicted dehydrogenase